MALKATKRKLRELASDSQKVKKITAALSELRADFELDVDTSKEQISKLRKSHINVRDRLENLINVSRVSSGAITGLRGTGKTHLMLLARDRINKDFLDTGNLAIYINAKRISIPDSANHEIITRLFATSIFESIIEQLNDFILLQSKESCIKSALLSMIPNSNLKKIKDALLEIESFKPSLIAGTTYLHDFEVGKLQISSKINEALENYNKLVLNFTKDPSMKIDMSESLKRQQEVGETEIGKYVSFLDATTVLTKLKSIIKLLSLKSITFYVDEWEKLFYHNGMQRSISEYINKIIDNPIYFWIAIVPYRGSVAPLSLGNDLQHIINLDENLVYEYEKDNCIKYFKSFIDQRLSIEFENDGLNVNCDTLINKKENLELLILSSMGNPRDFGTILHSAWSFFIEETRKERRGKGAPYQYISQTMIKKAIKQDGENKLRNLDGFASSKSAWMDLEKFSLERKTSHFSIEDTDLNGAALESKEFSELIYQRLLHKRKDKVRPKDSSNPNVMSIYALSFSAIFDHHDKSEAIKFVKTSKEIHDRVRRIIYNPQKIISTINIKSGDVHPCKSCGEQINILKMKAAWEKNSCPFCGGNIYNEAIIA